MQSDVTKSFESQYSSNAPTWGDRYGHGQPGPGEAALQFLQDYSRERPEVVAMWAFGIGFVLGWKLKPW
jgi:hypothetical protein